MRHELQKRLQEAVNLVRSGGTIMRIGNHRFATCCAALLLFGMSYVALAQERLAETRSNGSQASAPEVGYMVIRGVDGLERGIFYAIVDGVAIMEGDIILGPVEELERAEQTPSDMTDSVVVSGEGTRWPEAVLPYQLHTGLSSSTQDEIADAIAQWEANTPIRFVQRTASNQAAYPDYILFVQLSQGDIDTIGMLYGRDPRPIPSCESFGESFLGNLSGTDDEAVEPGGTSYFSDAGTHAGRLAGLSNADFDLHLLYWTGDSWVIVAESTGETSSEAISYSGPSGAYTWVMHSYEGGGSYTFCLNRP
jgi:hypothetical protein